MTELLSCCPAETGEVRNVLESPAQIARATLYALSDETHEMCFVSRYERPLRASFRLPHF